MCVERAMGIEPTRSAWKADVLPLNYARAVPEWLCLSVTPTRGAIEGQLDWGLSLGCVGCGDGCSGISILSKPLSASEAERELLVVGGTGFEPVKALPSDLQSDPFGHSGIPPTLCVRRKEWLCSLTSAPVGGAPAANMLAHSSPEETSERARESAPRRPVQTRLVQAKRFRPVQVVSRFQ